MNEKLLEVLRKIWHLLERSTVGRYVVAAVIALIALLLRVALVPLIGSQETYTTLFPAAILIAMLAGFWPAILIGFLGTLATEYFLIPPLGIAIDVPTSVRAAIMILSCALVGTLSQKMRQSRRQAQEKTRQLEKLNDKLDAKTKDLEAVITVVSHDLRAPLMNVRGFSKEIEKDCQTIRKLLSSFSVPEEAKNQLLRVFEQSIPESLNFIQTSAEMMNNIARSLVEVARAGLAVVKPERLDMNEILPKITAALEFKFKEAGAKVTFEPLPPCTADRQQVTQIVTNLIDNAVKYLDPSRQGRIKIWGKVEDERVVYCVEDNGIGIAPEHQEKVFEIFSRLGEKATGGEGIGLAMVKRMAERNEGSIRVESEKGKGSRFFVSLPV
jgi:signal transduction histidine kinase